MQVRAASKHSRSVLVIFCCSSGGYVSAQTVTWTDFLDVRRDAVGLTLSWCVVLFRFAFDVRS